MLKRKLTALSLALTAVLSLNTLTASALDTYQPDVSRPDKITDVRVNKPYLNFAVTAGEGVDLSNMTFSLKNSSGATVATFKSKNGDLNVKDPHAFDFSDYHSVEDVKWFPNEYSKFDDVYDLFTPDPVKGVAPSGYMYNAAGGGVINGDKYYLQFKDEYYYYYTDKKKFNIVDKITVPANTILVDTDAKYATNNDKNTYFWLEPISSPDLVSDHPETLPLKMCNVPGKKIKFRAQPGRYHVRVNGGRAGGYTCSAYDHETSYVKVKMPFNTAFPGLCNSDLTIDEEAFGKIYHYDLRGDQSKNNFSALYYSGAVISAPIPDANGDVQFWVSEDDLAAYMEYTYTFRDDDSVGGGGGSVMEAKLPTSVEKLNNVFQFPQAGYCIYNIKPDSYKLVLDDPALARDYEIVKSTIKVTNTKEMQKAVFKVNKKPLLLGDCNRDGKINMADVVLVAAQLRNMRKLDGRGPVTADVDCNGKITVSDVTRLAAYVRGLRNLPKRYV